MENVKEVFDGNHLICCVNFMKNIRDFDQIWKNERVDRDLLGVFFFSYNTKVRASKSAIAEISIRNGGKTSNDELKRSGKMLHF